MIKCKWHFVQRVHVTGTYLFTLGLFYCDDVIKSGTCILESKLNTRLRIESRWYSILPRPI